MSYLFDCYAGIYDGFMKTLHLDNTSLIYNYLKNQNLSIVDVGGGTGTLADLLQRNGHQVRIVDPSLSMLKRARKKNEDIELIPHNLDKNLLISPVDVMICRDTFHHFPHQKEALMIMKDYLKEDGQIIIHDFHPDSKRIQLLFLFERCCFEKIQPISLSTLIDLAAECHLYTKILYQGRWEYVCLISLKPFN